MTARPLSPAVKWRALREFVKFSAADCRRLAAIHQAEHSEYLKYAYAANRLEAVLLGMTRLSRVRVKGQR
jgi:hypothetical protein